MLRRPWLRAAPGPPGRAGLTAPGAVGGTQPTEDGASAGQATAGVTLVMGPSPGVVVWWAAVVVLGPPRAGGQVGP